jgi:hypothetical protein
MNSLPSKRPAFVPGALVLCVALSFAQAGSAQLRVGAVRVDITPPPGENGLEKPTGKYEHEHLYVRPS